jgi:release factor glutamine methyltransferase
LNADSTIKAALLKAAQCIYRETRSDEASLEAELLLCHALSIDLARLYQRLNDPIGDSVKTFGGYLDRRCAHEPTPYIIGRREFFGLDFEVSPAALIPRPETETLVEAVIDFANEQLHGVPFTMADIGVGCGTIAVAVAEALPDARVIAVDESTHALALASRNAERHGLAGRIDFRCGDLLDPLGEPVDIIAANLPYVTTADWAKLPPEIRDHEPRAALDGGTDGLRVIERLLREAPAHLRAGGALFAEIGDDQGGAAAKIARQTFPSAGVDVLPDLSGRDRLLVIKVA